MAKTGTTKRVGYEIDVVLNRVERLNNTKSGNPRYRLHTDQGLMLTSEDASSALTLTGAETGPVTLLIDGDKVARWRWPAQNADGLAADHSASKGR